MHKMEAQWSRSVCHCTFYHVRHKPSQQNCPTAPVSLSQYYLECSYITWEYLNSTYFTSKINSSNVFALFREIIIFVRRPQNPNCYVNCYKIICHQFFGWKCPEISLLLVLRSQKHAQISLQYWVEESPLQKNIFKDFFAEMLETKEVIILFVVWYMSLCFRWNVRSIS